MLDVASWGPRDWQQIIYTLIGLIGLILWGKWKLDEHTRHLLSHKTRIESLEKGASKEELFDKGVIDEVSHIKEWISEHKLQHEKTHSVIKDMSSRITELEKTLIAVRMGIEGLEKKEESILSHIKNGRS